MIFASYLKRLGLREHDASSASAGFSNNKLQPVESLEFEEPIRSAPFSVKPYGSYISCAGAQPWTPHWWTDRSGETTAERYSGMHAVAEPVSQL